LRLGARRHNVGATCAAFRVPRAKPASPPHAIPSADPRPARRRCLCIGCSIACSQS
jgi:hypothetical protein